MTPSRRTGVLISCGALLVLLLAAVFRGPLLEPLIILVVRQALGLRATIARVGGSVTSGLVLQGVSARAAAGAGPVTEFEAESISARYSLAALLRGKAAFLDSLEVTLAGARIDLDLTAPPAAGSRPAQRPEGFAALPPLPRLTVRDSRLRVSGRGYTLEADGLQGSVARPDQAHGQTVDLRAERFSLRHPSLREGDVSLAIAGLYGPRQLAITAAQVNGEPLVERARLDFGERRGDFDLQLALKLWQGAIEFGMLRRADSTEVRWDARGVDLQPQILLVNPALGALRGRLSTNGAARFGGEGVATLSGRLSLDWQGARLAGRAVDHLVIEGSAEPGVVLVARADGRVGPNEVQLRRVSLPAGPLFEGRWRALLAASSGDFTAALGDVPAFLALGGVSLADGTTAVPGHRLLLEGSLAKGQVRLARGDFTTGPGKAALAAVAVTFPREDQGWGETAFSGGATLDVPNLKDVSALFPMPPLSGSLRGSISGSGTFARPEGRASLTGRRVAFAGRVLGDVELQARAAARSIEIDTLQVRQGGNRFTAQGARFSTAAPAPGAGGFLDTLAGSFTLSSTDVPALAALAGIPPATVARTPAKHLLTAAGTVQGRALALTAGSFAAAGGTITVRSVRVALPPAGADWKKDTTFEGDLAVDLPDLGPVASIFDLPRLQGALMGRGKFSGTVAAPQGSVEATGRGIVIGVHRVGDLALKAAARQQLLYVESLEVTRGPDRLRGRGSYDLEKGTVLEAAAEISLADVAPYLAEFAPGAIPASGRLNLALRAAGPVPGTPLVLEATFSEVRIGSVQGIKGVAAANISFPGTLRRPSFSVTSRVTGMSGGPGGRPIQASLAATYEPGQLRIGAFELTGAGGLAVRGEGTLPLDLAANAVLSPGPVSIRAQASVPALEELAFLVPPAYALTGTVRADVVVTGSWREPEARLEIHGEQLQLPPDTLFAPPGPHTLAGTLTWGKAEARAENVRLESPALSFSLSGAWAAPPPLSALFAGSGAAATGSLSLRTTFSSPDIGWLQDSAAGLRGLRGGVAGEIAVDGPADDPAFSGEIRIAGGALRYRNLQQLDALVARASLVRRSVIIKEFAGNVGGSPFTLAGSVDFSRLDDLILDLRLQGKNVLLYRDEGLRVRADSDLTLRGPLSALSLTGEMALTNSLYQKNISVASLFSSGSKTAKRSTPGLAGISFPDPPLRNMRFDVRLLSREAFQIKTSVVRGEARPDLRLTGTGLLPILRGSILVDTARVMLPSGTLELERGTVLYRESDPDHPALDFGGRMQTMGYEITAQVGGTLGDPEIILSSQPALPREELLLLVLTGAPPGSAGAAGASVTAMASPMAVYLGKNVLEQMLSGKSRAAASGFQDRIELQVGRELTRSGSVTLDARLLLKKNPLGRGSTLYLTSEKDIYDQYNGGVKLLFKFK